ncbi:MAG: DoxX family protein [Acidobacteriaceae bacterium]
MKAKLVGYWIATIVLVFFLLPGGLFSVLRLPAAIDGMRQLGIPEWFAILLGAWKILGCIAIVVPRFPLLKEWAYAGMFFDLSGAVVCNAANHGVWWHIAAPAMVILFLVASWAWRPASRRLWGNAATAIA